jgi:phosphonate metabolism-associated iron-containing alcohol dehydrogenase
MSKVPGDRILLVTGHEAMRKHGHIDRIKALLGQRNFLVYDQVFPNPDFSVAQEGVDLAGRKHIDIVIGLGGGSCIDIGKTIAFVSMQGSSVVDCLDPSYLRAKTRMALPFIAIPTTAGTGSEVTRWATIWDRTRKRKESLEHEFLYPEYALIDPLLTLTTPRYLTAITGLDALCHAVESFWSKNSQPISDTFAIEAMKLIIKNIVRTANSPEDIHARKSMALGSLFAGLAFSNTKTTACHSISYPMTAHFNVPHGLACTITLPLLLQFNSLSMNEKVKVIQALFGGNSIVEASENIKNIMIQLDLPTTLSDLNITKDDIEIILNEGFTSSRMKGNPRQIERDDLNDILEALL